MNKVKWIVTVKDSYGEDKFSFSTWNDMSMALKELLSPLDDNTKWVISIQPVEEKK